MIEANKPVQNDEKFNSIKLLLAKINYVSILMYIVVF